MPLWMVSVKTVYLPPPKEDVVCGCGLPLRKCYRRLTAEERTEIIKAMERGI